MKGLFGTDWNNFLVKIYTKSSRQALLDVYHGFGLRSEMVSPCPVAPAPRVGAFSSAFCQEAELALQLILMTASDPQRTIGASFSRLNLSTAYDLEPTSRMSDPQEFQHP